MQVLPWVLSVHSCSCCGRLGRYRRCTGLTLGPVQLYMSCSCCGRLGRYQHFCTGLTLGPVHVLQLLWQARHVPALLYIPGWHCRLSGGRHSPSTAFRSILFEEKNEYSLLQTKYILLLLLPTTFKNSPNNSHKSALSHLRNRFHQSPGNRG